MPLANPQDSNFKDVMSSATAIPQRRWIDMVDHLLMIDKEYTNTSKYDMLAREGTPYICCKIENNKISWSCATIPTAYLFSKEYFVRYENGYYVYYYPHSFNEKSEYYWIKFEDLEPSR